MARQVCLKPCAPLNKNVGTFTVPLMGGVLTASGNLTIQSGCNGCEQVGGLMAQLNPTLSSFGVPICLLGCLAAVIKAVQAVPDSLGPPPNPAKLITAIENLVLDCKCVAGFALPPPIGVVCDFLKLLDDSLILIDQVLSCVISLLTHIIKINLDGSLLLMATNADLQATGVCVQAQAQQMMNILNGKLAGLSTVFVLIEPIVSFLSSVPGLGSVFSPLNTAFNTFFTGTPIGITPGDFLTELNTFKTALDTAVAALAPIVSVCP